MLKLSDVSLKKVTKFLDDAEALNELCYMQRSSIRINQVLVQNKFNKLKETTLVLRLKKVGRRMSVYLPHKVWREELDVVAEIWGHHSPIPKCNDIETQRNGIAAALEQLRKGRDVTKRCSFKKPFPICQQVMDCCVLKQALAETLENMRSLEVLELKSFQLDSEFLETMKHFASKIRSATTITIEKCSINWTERELTEFLLLFDHLKVVRISAWLKEPIINNQHISLVSDGFLVEEGYSKDQVFQEITSEICEDLLENGIKSINLGRYSTQLTMSAVFGLMESLTEKQYKKREAPNQKNLLNFGVLKYSNYRKIVCAQRNRNTIWRQEKWLETGIACKVHCTKSNVSYEFRIDLKSEQIDA